MKNKRIIIKESDINGDFLYRGLKGKVISDPILSNGMVCYFVKPDNDLPESLFLAGSIQVIEEEEKPISRSLVKVKDKEDLSEYNTVQRTMVGKIYCVDEVINDTYTILGQKFQYSDLEFVGLNGDFIRELFGIDPTFSLESGLIEVHNDLVKYKKAYERLANEKLSNDN